MKRTLIAILMVTLLIVSLADAKPGERAGKGQGWGYPGMEKGPDQMMDQDGSGFGPMHRCLAGLDLTEQQKQDLAKLQRDQQRKMVEFQTQLAGSQGKMKLFVTDDIFNKSKASALAEEISKIQKEKMMAHVLHLRAVRDLLKDNQKMIFDRNIMSAQKGGPGGKMHLGGHRGMGGGPGCGSCR